jgi:hypothetical protein
VGCRLKIVSSHVKKSIDFLRRERYPALKRWIAETEHGQSNGRDPSDNEELPPPPPAWRRVIRILGRIFSYRLFSRWRSLQLLGRLYVLAFTIAVLGFVSLPIYGKPTNSNSNFENQLVSTCDASSRPRIMQSIKCPQLSKTM